jgi:hypothetical protein
MSLFLSKAELFFVALLFQHPKFMFLPQVKLKYLHRVVPGNSGPKHILAVYTAAAGRHLLPGRLLPSGEDPQLVRLWYDTTQYCPSICFLMILLRAQQCYAHLFKTVLGCLL